jgi:hypothetical protein
VIDLGAYPKDAASVQDLIPTRDKEIEVLKKKLEIPIVDHVKTLDLQSMQHEKDTLVEQMA